MLKCFLKAPRPPKVSNEMICTIEKITCNAQDTNLSRYLLKTNVDHNLSGKGTATSSLDHSALTPRANPMWHAHPWYSANYLDIMDISYMEYNNQHREKH